jgi:hypothetical protein
MTPFFVITTCNEDYNWVKEYDNYIVYNKGEPIEDPHVLNVPNISGNIKDIPEFIIANYNNLPDFTLFTQAQPWDHCNLETFNKLINNTSFTAFESYGNIPANNWENRTSDGKFLEINNNWYFDFIKNQSCKYKSFDEFMNHYFCNYEHVDWVRFAPGAIYLVPKENIKYYPLSFWQELSNEMQTKFSTESFIIERALYYILSNTYNLKNKRDIIDGK